MKKIIFATILYFNFNSIIAQPAGSVIAYTGDLDALSEIDSSYLHCDGRILKISKYPKLFKSIGWAYLSGNDTLSREYFRIPDFRGYFLRGVDETSKIDVENAYRVSPRNLVSGAIVGSSQKDTIRIHSHDVIDAKHNHRAASGYSGSGKVGGGELTTGTLGAGDINTGPSSSNITISPFGGTETRPKNIYVYWVIKVR